MGRPADRPFACAQRSGAKTNRWPAVLRSIEVFNLQLLERFVLHSSLLQTMLLKTHERALRRLLPKLARVRTVKIVGGGMFPRTAILLGRMLPQAEITIVDASARNLEAAKVFIQPRTKLVHEFFDPKYGGDADL